MFGGRLYHIIMHEEQDKLLGIIPYLSPFISTVPIVDIVTEKHYQHLKFIMKELIQLMQKNHSYMIRVEFE